MSDWFSIQKIDEETFAISEYGHWEKVHSYLFIGSKKSLLVDTGTGIGDIKKEVDKLTDKQILVATTHCHWDHIGGHSSFKEIGVHEDDANWLENGIPIPLSMIKKNIMKEKPTKAFPKNFDINNYKLYSKKPDIVFKDGDKIDLGNRVLNVIHTPGHSPGHICIYEEAKGLLATGDLTYEGDILLNFESTDEKLYLKSIEKILKIKRIKKILPGHNSLNIKTNIIQEIYDAINLLKSKSLFHKGTGKHEFNNFSILL